MRRVEQSAGLVDLAVGEGTHEGVDTGDFGDDVADHAPSSRQLRHTASGIRHAGEAEAVFRQRRSHRQNRLCAIQHISAERTIF